MRNDDRHLVHIVKVYRDGRIGDDPDFGQFGTRRNFSLVSLVIEDLARKFFERNPVLQYGWAYFDTRHPERAEVYGVEPIPEGCIRRQHPEWSIANSPADGSGKPLCAGEKSPVRSTSDS